MTQRIDRRSFVRTVSTAGAGLAIASARILHAAEAPSQRIIIGVMGMGGRGTSLAETFASLPGVQVKYVCDPDKDRAAKAAAAVEKSSKGSSSPEPIQDFRRILDDRDVIALTIAACNHWHGPGTILGCAAGKHVYVEKPASHNAREGELMVEAARRHNRVVQLGTQRRSWPGVIAAIEKVREGAIGKVLFSRGWYNNSRGSIGRGELASPPANLDYTLWQGPAPDRPFRTNILHYNWHWFWHWGNGELGNNGIHALDLCRWGLGVDYPRKVTSGGGRYHFDDDQETPDTQVVTFDFGDKFITWEGRSCNPIGFENAGFGVSFYGDKGMLTLDGGGYRILDLKGKEVARVGGEGGDRIHLRNFIDCIRSGQKPNADIEHGHKSTLLCHLGNIAHRTGHVITCDPKNGRIVNDKDAELLWSREYRPGWEPKV